MIWTILRFRSFLGGYATRLSTGAALSLTSAFLALAQPWPLKVIVDSVLRQKPVDIPGLSFTNGWSRTELLDAAIAAYVAIILIGALFDYLGTYLMDSSGVRMVADVREALFARLQRLSLRFHGKQRTGDLITRIVNDISRVQDMLVQWFSVLVPNVALLVGMTVVMFLIDWQFTLIALAVGPPLFLVVYRYKTRIKGASRRARKLEGVLASRAGEVLGAVRLVQSFTREDFEDERFSKESSSTAAANLEATRLQAQFSPLVDVIAGAGTAVVLFVGTHRVLSGQLSLGLLLVFLSYLNSLYKPMRQLSKLAYVSSKGLASAERVTEVLEAEPDVCDAPGAEPAPPLEGRVTFAGVEFAYVPGQPVLRDIELTAAAGEVVALVGPTGAGKSTLAGLIPRFFDPQKGQVAVDGADVRTLRLQSLRAQIAIVPQEPIVFEGTIFDNIAYGRPEASEPEVLAAAEAALVDEFVRRLPESYDTLVGERGASLSGGERQRISIARALVREAPIVILDEPTSALDPRSERLLVEALENLLGGRTAFVIAHRMSTITAADKVIVLDHGRIVESGTHMELMRIRGGLYRSFWAFQRGTAKETWADEQMADGWPISPELVLVSPEPRHAGAP
ncbi:MAG TPA: ABC transporter ATP-binding protein [Gaiellaceae bacterium]|nr:ABC transporter ATP-binding protein [Gaiellaceae bacterium]